MSRKGYVAIRDLVNCGYTQMIDKVVIAHDQNMKNDYYEDMSTVCQAAGIPVYDKKESVSITSDYCIAIAWRWIIPLNEKTKLIIFHDSLLPKYRGFSPLVNMLINKEPYIGVSSLFASNEYDKGDIIAQRKIKVVYPIKITDAIDQIAPLYSELVCEILEKVKKGEDLSSTPQKEEDCSYSLWRCEDDYRIDWSQSAVDIQQFVYSVGYPFKGASAYMEGNRIRIIEAEPIQDVKIENRTCGKVIFMQNGEPVVVCGKGLLQLKEVWNDDCTERIKFYKFRTIFY